MSGRRRLAATAAAALVAGALALATALAPSASAAVRNDPACRPAPGRQVVVLVHGLGGSQDNSWNLLAPVLAADGHCPWSLDLPARGIGPLDDSARTVADFVGQVRATTGAARVSLVGHSLGGLAVRAAVRDHGLGDTVDDVVAIAGAEQGTSLRLAALAGPLCPACRDLAVGSAYVTRHNGGDPTPGGASYTQIASRLDTTITPAPGAALLPDAPTPGGVTNVVVQDRCPANAWGHGRFPDDPVVVQWVRAALDAAGPAPPDTPIDCSGLSVLVPAFVAAPMLPGP